MENNNPKNIDFSVPRRMSKSAFVVICYNELKKFISFFFIIIVLKFLDKESKTTPLSALIKALLILLAVVGFAIVNAFLNYYYKKYYVKDGNLIFMHGFIHRETTSIPVYKIHSMRTKRGIMYRLLDMKGVSFDTLASKTEEIELILDDDDWNALLSQVEAQDEAVREERVTNQEDSQQVETDTAHDESKEHTTHNVTQTLSFSNLNLIKGAFCQNHLKGMAIFASAVFAFYGKISEVGDKAINYAVDFVETNVSEPSFSITTFAVLMLVLYFLVMLLWIGNVFLRYFNMQVRINKSQLFFESGLFTRLSSQFSYDKVCTVYIKQNLLEKWFGCCTLNLKQAFNATDKKDESDVKIYGSNSSGKFLDWWLGKDFASSEEIITAHSGKGVLGYTIRTDIVLTLVAILALCYFKQYIWLTVPILYMMISLMKGVCAVYRSAITLKDDYLIINNGRLADIKNYIKYSNIEVVRLVRTPLTPYFHRVTLIISTNGTSFAIRSLKEQEAKYIYEFLLCFCRNED